MSFMRPLYGESFDVDCTVDIQNTFEQFHALVELDGNPALFPGDKVKVHGDPVTVPYGEKRIFRRTATVQRATALCRALTKFRSDFEYLEMFEVSFSSEKTL